MYTICDVITASREVLQDQLDDAYFWESDKELMHIFQHLGQTVIPEHLLESVCYRVSVDTSIFPLNSQGNMKRRFQ